jgi:beta-phosphoglucomutase-like phosphatase (HAD superfamily)
MQPEIGAVIFDMDGLMLDTEPLYKVAWQAAAAELGHPIDDVSYARLVGRPTEDCERELVGQFGPDFPLNKFRVRWPALWQAEVAIHGIPQKPGLLEFLAFLGGQGLPVAVATSSEADYAAFSLRHAGLEGRFSAVVTGDEVARGKPAPDIYLEAARRLRVSPDACVALEDSEAGIVAANRAGMRALLIPDWTRPSEAAVQAAFRVLGSLSEAHDLVARLVVDSGSRHSAG